MFSCKFTQYDIISHFNLEFICVFVTCIYIQNKIIIFFSFLPWLKASIWCLQWPVKFPQSKLGGGVQDTFRDDQEGRCLLLSVDPQLLCLQCFLTDLWHATNIVHENDVLTVLKGSLNMFTYFAETPEECCAEWGEHAISQSPPSVSQDSVLRKNAWFKYWCN